MFFVEKMREAVAMQKLLIFFSTKNFGVVKMLMFEILKILFTVYSSHLVHLNKL